MNDAAVTAAPGAEELLHCARLACGGELWDGVRAIHQRGTISLGGLGGAVEQTLQLDNGSSLLHYTLGPIEQRQGFDGTTAWMSSAGGEVLLQDSEAARRSAFADAYLDARAYWYPRRREAILGEVVLRHLDDKPCWVIGIQPRAGQPIELWIDAATNRVARIVKDRGTGGQRTQCCLDYREVDGLLVPHRLVSWKGEDAAHPLVLQFNTVQINPALDPGIFAPRREQLHDFELRGGDVEATIPFRLINNHIYLETAINGQSLQLMLDTGGANLLTPEAAMRAGIASQGALQAAGPGKGAAQAGLARVSEISIGGQVVLKEQAFRIVPLPGFDDVEGTPFDGLVGFELLKRFVVQIDYAGRRLKCVAPSRFSDADAGTLLPLSFHRTTPLVDAVLDGLPVQLEVDTGSRAGLTLWAGATNRHGLIARYGASCETAIGWGVGGMACGHLARGGVLRLGGFDMQRPMLALLTDAAAASSRPGVDGNLGGEILRRFTVTFDYPNRRLYLQPNHCFGEAMGHDRCGLWINRQGSDFVVAALFPGGPADRAGLAPGDAIVQIDAVPAADLALADLRRRLRDDPAGTRVRLRLRRDAAEHWVEVELRDLVTQEYRPPAGTASRC